MNGKTYIVAINAISGGGKTTITNALLNKLPNARALYFDDRNYASDSGIDDICEWVENGADANLFNLELLADNIENLLNESPDYILLDYPFGYRHDLIAKYIDLSVYIDTPLDIALARRIIRDHGNSSIMNIFNDMDQYLSQGRNVYLKSSDIARSTADFVVDGSKCIDEIAESIRQRIIVRTKL